ncbi:hypothetical protein VIN01S_22210 [Vibrio inusitatus NBRC 102082]|uniref:Uncharacterized protein n=1 Tax=Vibrio inusitatus NBRC 102082 TaxID=1219070 RepID=A0A4Y3HWH2_9VIBR|nr:hypothetical protein [Vibrio inusitatus]GEA51417.1 hypothetical protein VIN01S_22210 [Vibrio inusitatus NBRC 102082]
MIKKLSLLVVFGVFALVVTNTILPTPSFEFIDGEVSRYQLINGEEVARPSIWHRNAVQVDDFLNKLGINSGAGLFLLLTLLVVVVLIVTYWSFKNVK